MPELSLRHQYAELLPDLASLVFLGGDDRARTGDLLRAKQALSQLSYTPEFEVVGIGGLEPPTSRLSGVRSNHLSYTPIRSLETELSGDNRRR